MDLVVWDIENKPPKVLRQRLEAAACESFMLLTAWAKPGVPDAGDLRGLREFRHVIVEPGPDAADQALISSALAVTLRSAFDRVIIISGDKIFYRLQSRLAAEGVMVLWDDVEMVPVVPSVALEEPRSVTWTADKVAAEELRSTLTMIRKDPIGLLLSAAVPSKKKEDSGRLRLAVVMDGLSNLTGQPVAGYVENARACNLLAGQAFGHSDEDRLAQSISKLFNVSANARLPLSDEAALKVLSSVANSVNAHGLLDAEQLRTFASAPRASLPHCSLVLQSLGRYNLLRRRSSDRVPGCTGAHLPGDPPCLRRIEVSAPPA